MIYNLSDTSMHVEEPQVNYKGLASSGGQNKIYPLVPKLCLDVEDVLWSTTKLVSPFLEVKCTFYRFYKCRLCACAEIIGHSKLTMKPFANPRLLSGFDYNSTDTPPK